MQKIVLLATPLVSLCLSTAVFTRSRCTTCSPWLQWIQVKFPPAVSERLHALAAEPNAAADRTALGVVRSIQNADQVCIERKPLVPKELRQKQQQQQTAVSQAGCASMIT